MKRFVNILLALLLCSATLLVACDNGNQPEETEPDSSTAQETEQPTEQETEAPTTEEITEIATEEETIVPNDGKTKKFFTLSLDDGITQDLKVIEILKKYIHSHTITDDMTDIEK